MTYLDNAATSYPKPACVYKKLFWCLKNAVGNPGRAAHRPALRAAEEIYEAREAIAELLDFSYPERIVFTQNATHALNLAIRAFGPHHTIYSDREHNSVIRPIEALSAHGCGHKPWQPAQFYCHRIRNICVRPAHLGDTADLPSCSDNREGTYIRRHTLLGTNEESLCRFLYRCHLLQRRKPDRHCLIWGKLLKILRHLPKGFLLRAYRR